MRICVYGAASPTIDEKYISATERMGEALSARGHSLVFGGGNYGLMGAAARGFRKGGAHIVGVIPKFFFDTHAETLCSFCNEVITPDTMRERKQIMEDAADAFIVTPGGIGTYEEFFEILTLKQLCRHKKPIALYNLHGFYNELSAAIQSAMSQQFINESCKELYLVSDDLEEILRYIEAPAEIDYSLKHFKNG